MFYTSLLPAYIWSRYSAIKSLLTIEVDSVICYKRNLIVALRMPRHYMIVIGISSDIGVSSDIETPNNTISVSDDGWYWRRC